MAKSCHATCGHQYYGMHIGRTLLTVVPNASSHQARPSESTIGDAAIIPSQQKPCCERTEGTARRKAREAFRGTHWRIGQRKEPIAGACNLNAFGQHYRSARSILPRRLASLRRCPAGQVAV